MSKKDEKERQCSEECAEKQDVSEETVSTEKEEKTVSEEEKLKEELKAKNDSYLRLLAEYDNYRKRSTADKANIYADATARAIKEILPIGDSLDMALNSLENVPEEYKKGIELIGNQFRQSLEKLNVETFGEKGEPFNPNLHNAVMKIEDDTLDENVIAQVFQKGYKTGDRIIRHAMVQVANCD